MQPFRAGVPQNRIQKPRLNCPITYPASSHFSGDKEVLGLSAILPLSTSDTEVIITPLSSLANDFHYSLSLTTRSLECSVMGEFRFLREIR